MKMIKSVIFDLDGTLADTIKDITAAVNVSLSAFNFPPHDDTAIKLFVGDGIKELISRALPPEKSADKELNDKCLKNFKQYYDEHFCDYTTPYEHMHELLQLLKTGGIRLAVVTNKNEEAAVKVVEKLFPDTFEIVIGNSDKIRQKPDPTEVLKIMEIFGADKTQTLYVGDSHTDIETAKNAGVRSVGCLWGFRTLDELQKAGADFIVKDPLEIAEIVGVK
jgi:phosphoglycolate phosphatase